MYIDGKSEEISPDNKFETNLDTKEDNQVPIEDNVKEDKGKY